MAAAGVLGWAALCFKVICARVPSVGMERALEFGQVARTSASLLLVAWTWDNRPVHMGRSSRHPSLSCIGRAAPAGRAGLGPEEGRSSRDTLWEAVLAAVALPRHPISWEGIWMGVVLATEWGDTQTLGALCRALVHGASHGGLSKAQRSTDSSSVSHGTTALHRAPGRTDGCMCIGR